MKVDTDDLVFYVSMGLLAIFCLGGIVFLFIQIPRGNAYDARMMQDCMDDGHKEYECVSMLRRHYRMVGKTMVPD